MTKLPATIADPSEIASIARPARLAASRKFLLAVISAFAVVAGEEEEISTCPLLPFSDASLE